MAKKTGSLIALLLLTATFNSHSMEPQQPSKWALIVGGVLLGAVAIKMLWQPKQELDPKLESHVEQEPVEPFPFTDLPKDMQNQIIYFLGSYTTATTLKEAAFTINSLAQVNNELNAFINDPKFCLQVIKHLAHKFNCSDEEAAEALKTKEAKRRLMLQRALKNCLMYSDNPKDMPIGDIDFNFTYFDVKEKQLTPLMIALKYNYSMIQPLLLQGADINTANSDGITALMFAVEHNLWLHSIDILLTSKDLIINKQDLDGNTALMRCCLNTKQNNPPHHKIINKRMINTLVNAGADPELANFAGLTPLAAAQATGDQEIIDLIQDAIAKKHGGQ